MRLKVSEETRQETNSNDTLNLVFNYNGATGQKAGDPIMDEDQ